MACSRDDLVNPPACLEFTSATRQLKARLLLLAQALDDIDGAFVLNWADIKSEAQTFAACVPTGEARAKAAQVVESGLAEADVDVFACDSIQDLEQMALYLTCLLVTALNP